MIELRELRNLIILCQHRHFGRAAAALGISQPALTKSIQRFEQSLGTQLVDRTRTGVVATPVGEEVLRRAQPLLSNASELEREIELMRGVYRGPLSVGIGPAMSESPIIEAIARQIEGRSGVDIQIRVDHWSQLSEWLLERKIDLFIADMTEAQQDDRYLCQPLPQEKFVWFCRADHPLATQKRVTRRDLLQFPLASPRMPEWAQEWFSVEADGGGTSAESPIENRIECENYAMLKRIVLNSDCISGALDSTIAQKWLSGQLFRSRSKHRN